MSEEITNSETPPQPGELWVHPFKGVMAITGRLDENRCMATHERGGEIVGPVEVDDAEFAGRLPAKYTEAAHQ